MILYYDWFLHLNLANQIWQEPIILKNHRAFIELFCCFWSSLLLNAANGHVQVGKAVWRLNVEKFFIFFINYIYLFIIQLISSINVYINLIIKNQY